MALLSKKEFAQLCMWETKQLSVYIGRGQVVVRGDKMIDTNEDKNVAFLEKYGYSKAVLATPAEPKPEKAKEPPRQAPQLVTVDLGDGEQSTIDLSNIPSYQDSERLLKYLDTEKRQKEIEKLQLDIEKKQGEVIPVAPIEQLVFQFKQYTLTQGKIAYEKFLTEIGHKYSITPDDLAYYRGFFIKQLNTATTEATEAFNRDMDIVLNEFSVKKGVGERA